VEVETIDKAGNFLGSLVLAVKRNSGTLLVEAGLARLHGTILGQASRWQCTSAGDRGSAAEDRVMECGVLKHMRRLGMSTARGASGLNTEVRSRLAEACYTICCRI
jgi:hypothetical protein